MASQGSETADRSRAEVALFGLYEVSKALSKPQRLELTLASVINLLSSFLDMRSGLIALLDEEGQPEIVVGNGWSESAAKRFFERLPERAIGQIIATKMPLVVQDVNSDPLFAGWSGKEPEWMGGNHAFIGVPIMDRDAVVGTLTINRESAAQSEYGLDHDVRFMTMVSSLLGHIVRLHRVIARDRDRLMEERHRLEKALDSKSPAEKNPGFAGIVGDSPAIRSVLDKVRIAARSSSTVLLRGESGTGKEIFARALHDLSPRKDKPFVAVNCAALAESVLESEMFGHEKGAFTGAVQQRRGRFELADGGTLFLDEIGEISLPFQAKLLRVLQENEFERVGGTRTLKVDVRLVAATNRNLEEAVARGSFRADLYYRINVVPIFLPPLRDRPSDVPLLAREFLRRFNVEHGTGLELTDTAYSVLLSCLFPGNVRELENCIRRTATLAPGPTIGGKDFACRNDQCLSAMLWQDPDEGQAGFIPLPIANKPPPAPRTRRMPGRLPLDAAQAGEGESSFDGDAGPAPLDDDSKSARDRLLDAMEASGWVQARAARMLGLSARQIGYALRKHGIPSRKF